MQYFLYFLRMAGILLAWMVATGIALLEQSDGGCRSPSLPGRIGIPGLWPQHR